MISRPRQPAVYRRIADELAARIRSGELAPGDTVPSADLIRRLYGVGMATANHSLDILKAEGLIDAVPGRPSRVRAQPVRRERWLRPGTRVLTRPATAEERGGREWPDNTWVHEVYHRHEFELLRADQVELIFE